MRYLLLFSLILLTFCKSQKLQSSLTFQVLEKGEYSVEMTEQQQLVRSQSTMDTIYQRLKTHNYPKQATPVVDFKNFDVIFIHFGTFNQGGHVYNLKNIQWQDDELYIEVKSPEVNKDMPVTMALTQPYMLILVEKLKKEPKGIRLEKL